LNDLKDWDPDGHDKVVAGQDLLSDRPTLLRAMAWETTSESGRRQLRRLAAATVRDPAGAGLERLRAIYEACGALAGAKQLIAACRARALAEADGIEPPALRGFMRGLVEVVL
jgi:geranylgeranyl pyrophosphate synthase